MDISDTLAPNSDQLDAVDLLGGPRIFTIEKVSAGNAEQPVNIKLREFDRVWRPGKSMRRVLASCWGTDGAAWTDRRVELFCDTSVVFGGKEVGGTRISRLSHIDKPKKIPLLVTRGKSATFTVEPLPDAPAPTPPTPTTALLDEIGKLADQAGVARQTLADQWAASHDGQNIRQATDVGGLELLRDDLAAQVSK